MQANTALPVQGEAQVREILVVDDMPEICEFFALLLRRARNLNVRVTTEVNSARAVELLRGHPFDVVVSDFRMREVDGVEVLTAARAVNPNGIRVLMTGYNEIPASGDRIREARVDAYLQKPLRSQDLFLLLLELMNRNPEILGACREHAREMEMAAEREAQAA